MRFITLHIVFLLIMTVPSYAADWKSSIVRGNYKLKQPVIDSWGYYKKGDGNSHFSFKPGTSKSTEGDIWLEVSVHKLSSEELRFRLNGDWFIDLGNTLPKTIEIPDQFATPSWRKREPHRMIKGNYYILSGGRLQRSVLIQVTEIDISRLKHIGYREISVDYAVAFRYRNVSNSLPELLTKIKNTSNN